MAAPLSFSSLYTQDPTPIIEAGLQIADAQKKTLNQRVNKKIIDEGKVEAFQKQAAPIIEAIKESKVPDGTIKSYPPDYPNPKGLDIYTKLVPTNEPSDPNAVYQGRLGTAIIEVRKKGKEFDIVVIRSDKRIGVMPATPGLIKQLEDPNYYQLFEILYSKDEKSAKRAYEIIKKINGIFVFAGITPPDWKKIEEEVIAASSAKSGEVSTSPEPDVGEPPGPADPKEKGEPHGKEKGPPTYYWELFTDWIDQMAYQYPDAGFQYPEDLDERNDLLKQFHNYRQSQIYKEKDQKKQNELETEELVEYMHLKESSYLPDQSMKGKGEPLGEPHGKKVLLDPSMTIGSSEKLKERRGRMTTAMKILTQKGYGKFASHRPSTSMTGFGNFRKEIKKLKKDAQTGTGAFILKSGNVDSMAKQLRDRIEMWKLGNENPRILSEIRALLKELIEENQISSSDATQILGTIGKSF